MSEKLRSDFLLNFLLCIGGDELFKFGAKCYLRTNEMCSNEYSAMDNLENCSILSCSGSDFFKRIEREIKTKLPECLKLILLHCDFDSAVVFTKIDNTYIAGIENVVRTELSKDVIPTFVKLEDYLGKYTKCQNEFRFSLSQIILLKLVAATCKKLMNVTEHEPNENSDNADPHPNVNLPQHTTESILIEGREEFNDFEYKNLTSESKTPKASLFNYIGSLMITIFNDAKRLTLSSWSWPSWHVATEKAEQFKATGDPAFSPDLHYVTPSQHKEFLDCIVQSDTSNLGYMLRDSLALSLRVDGSVDRAQKHNIYVMGHVVHKNTTISTVFLGFEIPKAGKSLGYFECMKSVVGEISPWEECMSLITSLVTDGEALYSGSEQGLWIRFINEVRNSNSSNQPVIAVWCVPHRFNLGWKGACRHCPIISNIIGDATSLSSYFHSSGERTRKLIDTAAQKTLPTPLRYVTHYEIRWTEFVFDLLTVTLRNWRAAINFFKSEKEIGLTNRWLLYDCIHLLAFITDVLQLLKKFRKKFQSDTVSLLTIQEVKDDGDYFHRHKLLKNSGRSASCVFDIVQRKHILDALILHLNERLDCDLKLREDLKPLLKIKSTVSDQSIKLCYISIASDLDEEAFNNEYKIAANILNDYYFKNPHETLQTLYKLVPDRLPNLKTALARVVAAKPHSGDVERLISSYNKAKTPDRISLSGLTLFNYLYAKVNMTHVNNFDPSIALVKSKKSTTTRQLHTQRAGMVQRSNIVSDTNLTEKQKVNYLSCTIPGYIMHYT